MRSKKPTRSPKPSRREVAAFNQLFPLTGVKDQAAYVRQAREGVAAMVRDK